MGVIDDSDFNLDGWGRNKALIEGTCGHCDRAVVFKAPSSGDTCLHFEQAIAVEEVGDEIVDHFFVMGLCPNPRCQNATIVYRVESYIRNQNWESERSLVRQEVIHPAASTRRILADEVPQQIRDLYMEAGQIEYLSPNSAAFIARRILEQTLRAELKSKKRLVELIDLFLNRSGIPDELHQLMHDVRGFGNIAGHPSQDEAGEWINVDQEEASYILDVVRELLEFVHVRPARQRAMRERLEAKNRGERPSSVRSGDVIIGGRPEKPPVEQVEDDLPF